MSKLLFDEQPLIVSRELAKLIGLNEAIVLQQIHYWLEINRKVNNNLRDGRYWTYNSIKNWHEKDFSFWSFNTVQRTFTSLVKKGFLIMGNYNKQKFDQTKWYSIDYKALETLNLPITPNWGNASPQIEVIEYPNLGQPIPENNTEIKLSQNISSYPIISVLGEIPKIEKEQPDEMRFDEIPAQAKVVEPEKKQKKESSRKNEKPSEPRYSINDVIEIIKDNIDYNALLVDKIVDEELLNDVTNIIATTICTDFKDGWVSMGNDRVSAEAVRSTFFKLTKEDIEYFAECFDRQIEPVTKMTAYVRKALLNNRNTMALHYNNRVHVDMPHLASPKIQSKLSQ